MSQAQQNSSGDELIDFARRYKLNGDWLVCLHCKAPQQISWSLHKFPHRIACSSAEGETHPWQTLHELIRVQIAHAKPNSESVSTAG